MQRSKLLFIVGTRHFECNFKAYSGKFNGRYKKYAMINNKNGLYRISRQRCRIC